MSIQTSLLAQDSKYLLHPLHHPETHKSPLIISSGDGILLRTVEGREYIDGLAGLWNVLIGHGSEELAGVAQMQMETIAYCSNYTGSVNIPVIELSEKLAGFAYPNLSTTYFASGGAEANESAFKTVRYYWKRKGKPKKVKIIARMDAYHGVTLGAMSATGIPAYWHMFEPRLPNFLHIPSPNPFRYQGDIQTDETVGMAAARALEEAILREGPDTVGGLIAEPVQGAGGVIVPPDDYFPRVREVCDRYNILLIADEVITGFGRTGEWFALKHWGIQPDIMTFAKGITSGYLPLSGIQISDDIYEVIVRAPPEQTWMHANTYSGHPACCAVAIKNLEILERQRLVQRAEKRGRQMLSRLTTLKDFTCVGDVRGLGLMCAVEFVSDRKTKAPAGIGEKVRNACIDRGLFTRIKGDILMLAPPLIITEEDVDKIVQILRESINSVVL